MKKSKRRTKRRTKRGGAIYTTTMPLLSQDEKNNIFISEIKRLNGEVSTLKTRVNVCCGKSSIPKTTTEALQLMSEKGIDEKILQYGRPLKPIDQHPLVLKVFGDVKPGSRHTGRPCKEVIKEMLSGKYQQEFTNPERIQRWINSYCNSTSLGPI